MQNETPSFENFLSHPDLIKSLRDTMGFKAPTPIQVAVAPLILAGKDVYAGAKTGSGKTIAFLAPIAERILKGDIERALILCPTRELALQIDEEAMKLLEGHTDLISVPLYGGVPIDPQILALKAHKPKIIVATPGRCYDLVQEGILKLSNIQVAVLDEADRMCDMGFAPQVSQILDLMHDRKQMLLFSATLPRDLTMIMAKYCPTPEKIVVDAADQATETLHHMAVFVSRRDKLRELKDFLSSDPEMFSVIFTKTRSRADELYDRISGEIEHIAVLHAGLPMQDRERILKQLKDGKIHHLVATDVFARGIDVEGITHVIHFDLPFGLEEYIHRSGRSGRAGRTGTTLAFVDIDSDEQIRLFRSFQTKIEFEPLPGKSFPNFDQPRGRSGGSHSHPRTRRGKRPGERQEQSADRGPQEHRQDRPSSRGPGAGGPRQGRRHSQSGGRPQHPNARPAKAYGQRTDKKPTAAAAGPKKNLLSKTKSFIKSVFGKRP